MAYSDTDANLACRAVTKRLSDGRLAYEHHGLACTNGGDSILVAASSRLPAVLHHEIWHMVEHHLSLEDMNVLNKSIDRGADRSGFYLAFPVERRARAYEAWASAVDEGWSPATVLGTPIGRLDRIFSYVHSGKMAADLTSGKPVRSRTFPVVRLFRESLTWPYPLLWGLGAVIYWAMTR